MISLPFSFGYYNLKFHIVPSVSGLSVLTRRCKYSLDFSNFLGENVRTANVLQVPLFPALSCQSVRVLCASVWKVCEHVEGGVCMCGRGCASVCVVLCVAPSHTVLHNRRFSHRTVEACLLCKYSPVMLARWSYTMLVC